MNSEYLLILTFQVSYYLFIYLFIYLLAMLRALRDLSSPTRDWTQAPGMESSES